MEKPRKPRGMTTWPLEVPVEERTHVITVDWDLLEGRWEPKAIRFAAIHPEVSGPITGAVLRSLPIGRIVDEIRRNQADLARKTFDQLNAEGVEVSEEHFEAWRKGERPRLGRSHYEQVAAVYTAAFLAGERPTKAVADKFMVGDSTAASWVSRARHKYELLPQTPSGKAGI